MRADVIPQLADARRGAPPGIDVPAGIEPHRARAERARAGPRGRWSTALRAFTRCWSSSAPPRRTTARNSTGRSRGLLRGDRADGAPDRPRPACAADRLDRHPRSAAPTRATCPLERVLDLAARMAAAGRAGDQLRRHDRDGQPAPGAPSSTPAARPSGCPASELTAHFHNTRGQGLANALAALDAGIRELRVELRAARRLPGAAPARPATSPPRTSSRCSHGGDRHGDRPGGAARREPATCRPSSAARWAATC